MSLLDSLITSGANIESLAEDWLRDYNIDSRESFLRIVSLIFHTCGLTQNIPRSVYEVGWLNFVKALEIKLPKSALSTYPIIDGRKNLGKQISRKVCDFIGMILSKAEEDILQDQFFFTELRELLNILTKSSLRAFRHTATVIVVKMMTHLSSITKNLTLQHSRIDRMLSICEREQSRGRSSARRESLENLLVNSSLRISSLEEQIIFFIRVVLPKRFRDVYVPIRLVCLEELEVWLLKYPNAFMDHSNLKYLGWALSDSYVTMRHKSIQVLKKIYLDEELSKHMEMDLFTLKFKPRIVAMSLDKNITVSILAIQVISGIHRISADRISLGDIKYIFRLVYSQSIEVAYEVAGFIHQVITFALKDKLISEKSKLFLSLLELKDVVTFTESEEKIPLLVDAMLCQASVKYLNDWECFAKVLLNPENIADESHDQESNLNASLNIEEERIVLSLMENSAKQVLLDENPRSLLRSKKFMTIKALRMNEEYRESSIKFFLKYLPKLLNKYMPHGEIICSLLSLCLVVDVNKGAGQDIQVLVTSLLEVSERHVDSEIHLACSNAMAHLCKGRSTLAKYIYSSFMDPYLQEIVSSWEDSMREYSRKCAELEDFAEIVEEEELLFKMEKNSRRLLSASCHFEMGKLLDWEVLIGLCRGYCVGETGSHHPITTTVMRNSLKTALTYILHELPIESVEENDLLKYHIDDFLFVGEMILKDTKDLDYTVRITAYHCLSEIMCIICQTTTPISDLWKETIVTISNILMENILELIHRKEGFDELSEDEEIELIQNYCSLILKGGLPPAATIHLLKNINTQMIASSWSYVETTLTTVLSWNVEEFSLTVLGCLTSYYNEVLEKEGVDLLESQSFGELMRLAENLYERFGLKMGEDTKASLKFHLRGIQFASAIVPDREEVLPQIHFTKLLIVFAPVVDPKFRSKLLNYLGELQKLLKKKLPSVSEELIDNLSLFSDYEKILSSSEWVKKPKKQAKKRGRKAVNPGIPEEEVE